MSATRLGRRAAVHAPPEELFRHLSRCWTVTGCAWAMRCWHSRHSQVMGGDARINAFQAAQTLLKRPLTAAGKPYNISIVLEITMRWQCGEGAKMRELLGMMKALADENRLRIVAALKGRELCLCQLVELLGLANSTVSRHASILQQARIVDARKQGRWTYFRLAESPPAAVVEATAIVVGVLERDARGREDRKHLKQMLRMDPEQLCRQQSECK